MTLKEIVMLDSVLKKSVSFHRPTWPPGRKVQISQSYFDHFGENDPNRQKVALNYLVYHWGNCGLSFSIDFDDLLASDWELMPCCKECGREL